METRRRALSGLASLGVSVSLLAVFHHFVDICQLQEKTEMMGPLLQQLLLTRKTHMGFVLSELF